MKTAHDIILAPVVSEKSYDLIEKNNTYTFEVDPRSNKEEIRDESNTKKKYTNEKNNLEGERKGRQ
jgi:ribosomal protein L23